MPTDIVEGTINGSSESNAQQTEPVTPNEDGDRTLWADQLQPRDHADLLSAIDRLREERIDEVIEIPQIVVCGNQSSGKSSVLEAIARVAFPTGASTITRFATEVILRKSPEERGKARIIASSERDGDVKRRIEGFQRSFDSSTHVDFGRVITEAGSHLQQIEQNVGFWKDWLQVEIFGPSQPHLTLVDLPGIIQYEREAQDNAQTILDLLNKYVENRRTTVLAVVDGLNDYQNQKILKIITTTARDRTLGVITKTDELNSGSDHLRNVIRLAKNESVPLRLGWHVLSNLPHEETDRSSARRDEREHQLFAGRDWSELPRRDVGIACLRSKLSHQLLSSITQQLPGSNGLIAEMRQQRRQCQDEIKRLGPNRRTLAEQRAYLSEVLNRLSRLIEDAIDGNYEREEFDSFFDRAIEKKLRDRIRGVTKEFVKEMGSRGKQYHVCVNEGERGSRLKNDHLEELNREEKPNFSAPYTTASSNTEDGQVNAYNVHLTKYCRALARHMEGTRGRNLEGMPLTITIRSVFRQLSSPWTGIAETFAEHCCDAVQTFLELAIRHVAGEHTGDALRRAYVYPNGEGLERRRAALTAKIEELLWPFKKCHPITYHPSFNPASVLESYSASSRPAETWGEIARESQYRQDFIQAADALDTAESYYNIALNTFIENVTTLGIEQCLLKDLASFISPREAVDLNDSKIEELAAEPAEVVRDRATAVAQEAALDEVIRVCCAYLARDPEATRRVDKAQDEDETDDSDIELDTPPRPEEADLENEDEDEDEPEAEEAGEEGPSVEVRPANHGSAPTQTFSLPAQPRPNNVPQFTGGQTQPLFATLGTSSSTNSTANPVTASGAGSTGGNTSSTGSTGGGNFGGGASTSSAAGTFGGGASPVPGRPLFGGPAPSGNPIAGSSRDASTGNANRPASGFAGFGTPAPNPGTAQPSSNGGVDQQHRGSLVSQQASNSAAGPSLFGASGGGSTSGKSQTPVHYTPTRGTLSSWQFRPYLMTHRGPFSVSHLDTESRMVQSTTENFQSLGVEPEYLSSSFEELRLDDYNAGRIRPDPGSSVEV